MQPYSIIYPTLGQLKVSRDGVHSISVPIHYFEPSRCPPAKYLITYLHQEVQPLYKISNSMEVDTVPIEEVLEVSPQVASHPLALDLNKRCSLLLQDLGVASSSKPRLPVDVAQVVFDYAFNTDDELSIAALLESLSGLMAVDGLSSIIIAAFGPILPDLLARWLENTDSSSAADWEARLVTVAGLAALRPDLWRYVPCSEQS